ncbi:MAG: glutamine--fructose-6-phosphate transaminase (isomerizing), partial [Candidatus Levyibacteriota bacterium]
DTEVIAHLIEDFYKELDFPTSVRQTFNMLHGLNAIVVVNARSSEIVAAKNGSPLVVGVGKEEFFIASDVAGILHHTKDVIFLKDHEMVVLGKEVKLLQLPDGKEIQSVIEKISWKIEQAEKGEFEHFLLKEIYEQPKIIRNVAQNYSDQVDDLAEVLSAAQGIFFIGAGTASYACLAGSYLFSKIANMHVNTLPASEFNYLEDFLTKKSLVIALSQSGETIDVIEPLTRAKQKGSKIACLVNALGSTIYRMSDYKMLLGAGPEKAVAATKSYSAKLSLLLMLSFSLARKMTEAETLLLEAADIIDELLSEKKINQIQMLAKMLAKKEHMYTIGRGFSYPTALEAALKVKEVSYIHAEGLAGGELKHGSLALIEKGTPCIVFAPQDETYEAIISNAIEIKSRGGFIIGISSKNSQAFDEFIEVKHVPSSYILTQIVPVQLLAYFLALEKGLDPDKPRNLAKSVTVK